MRTDRKKNNFLRHKEQQKSVAVISWSVRVSKGIVDFKSTTRGSFRVVVFIDCLAEALNLLLT